MLKMLKISLALSDVLSSSWRVFVWNSFEPENLLPIDLFSQPRNLKRHRIVPPIEIEEREGEREKKSEIPIQFELISHLQENSSLTERFSSWVSLS